MDWKMSDLIFSMQWINRVEDKHKVQLHVNKQLFLVQQWYLRDSKVWGVVPESMGASRTQSRGLGFFMFLELL